MGRILLVMFLIALSGCNRAPPTLAGGKWAETLCAHDAKLRKKAAFTLGNIGLTDPAVLPALIGALKDTDPGVRCEAILALLKCGPEAKEAVPVLTEVLNKDRDAKVRAYASKALERIGSGQ